MKKPFPPYKFSPECSDTSNERDTSCGKKRKRSQPSAQSEAHASDPAWRLDETSAPFTEYEQNGARTPRIPVHRDRNGTRAAVTGETSSARYWRPHATNRMTHSKQRSIFQISGPLPSPNKWIKEGRRIQSSTGSTRSLCGTWPLTQTCMSAILS